MAIATIHGVEIDYRVIGTRGPWLALTPGGRRCRRNILSCSSAPRAMVEWPRFAIPSMARAD
jgi:hypothetical protein